MEYIKETLKSEYDKQYLSISSDWREFAGKSKAQNIVEITAGLSFIRVLEVGAGDGSILKHLGNWNFAAELYAVEISETALEKLKNKNIINLKEAKLFDGYKIPYPDKYFDLVILSHVLEHVEFERLILREIKRVGKYVVIEVPRDYKPKVDKRVEHFLSYGHINVYTPATLKFLIKSEGFEVLKESLKTYNSAVFYHLYFSNGKKTLIKYLLYFYDSFVRRLLIKLPIGLFREMFPSTITLLAKPLDNFRINLK